MTERQLEERLRAALEHAAPNDVEGVLSRCKEGLCAVLFRLTEKFPGVLFEAEGTPSPGLFAFFRRFRTEAPLRDASAAYPQNSRRTRSCRYSAVASARRSVRVWSNIAE